MTNNIDDTNTIIFEYSDYDKVGNRKSMKIDDANAHVYTYDVLYQLTNADYNDGNNTDYYYDDVGNRTSTNDGSVTTYLHNILNQYYSVGGTGYSYDDNGNLTDDGTYEYYYDCENRLTDVNENGAVVATYEYDFAGRRISKTVDSNTTEYVYDGAQVIAEYENDTLVRKFVYGPGIDEPICMIDAAGANAVYYYHFDGLGSVVALSDVNKAIVETYEYDAFGTPDNTSSIGNPYLFTGRRYDNETGLYYYRARHYDPETGRFLQTDPLGYIDSMNLYAYCGNNPINWIDPWGLEISQQTHKVFWSWYHTSIRITPENQQAYKNHPDFKKHVDKNGKRYATIGAGPVKGKLKSDINRKKDVNLSIKVQNQPIDLKGRNEDDVIKQLFGKDSNYKDSLPYEKFPDADDDNYNSNSYTKGLLDSAGLEVPKPNHNVPGYDKPVPDKYFECKKGQN